MIANIRGGMDMVNNYCTVISFAFMIIVYLLDRLPLDCLGLQDRKILKTMDAYLKNGRSFDKIMTFLIL